MTASSADTAQIARVRPSATLRTTVPVAVAPVPAPAPAPPAVEHSRAVLAARCPPRTVVRAERLAARRERQAWAALGVGALAAVLGLAVAVLGVLH